MVPFITGRCSGDRGKAETREEKCESPQKTNPNNKNIEQATEPILPIIIDRVRSPRNPRPAISAKIIYGSTLLFVINSMISTQSLCIMPSIAQRISNQSNTPNTFPSRYDHNGALKYSERVSCGPLKGWRKRASKMSPPLHHATICGVFVIAWTRAGGRGDALVATLPVSGVNCKTVDDDGNGFSTGALGRCSTAPHMPHMAVASALFSPQLGQTMAMTTTFPRAGAGTFPSGTGASPHYS